MNDIRPPYLAEWLLRHTVATTIRYSAMGDFEQIHAEIAESEGMKAANAWYWRQVLQSLPFFISDTITWTIVMLKNYFRVARRNLLKNKASSLVNIFGLSIAVATAIVAFVFIENMYTMDSFHENADNIFLVENYIERGEDVQLRGDTPAPLGPAMAADIPQVKRAVRVAGASTTFRAGGNTFDESIRLVDPDFLDLFSFQLRLGDKSAPIGQDEIILSDALATKYFGTENPMNQQLEIIFNESERRLFTVRGVAQPFPKKMSFGFSALIHYDHARLRGIEDTDWEAVTWATFIELENPADIELVAGQMEDYQQQQAAANPDGPISAFKFENLRTLSINSHAVSGDISGGTNPASVISLSLIAVFLLLLSCINYMNLAVATASRRLKEIGVRKAIGSSKTQIVQQFLSENILICLFSLLAGLAIAVLIFIPGFNALTDIQGGDISLGAANTFYLWVFLVGLLLITGLLSGAYPAFYISKFKPVSIFRGRTKLGGENWFSRGLLTFQFILAFMTMIQGVIMAQNANYQANRDWGYESEHLLVLETEGESQFSVLKSEIEQLSGVESVVGSRDQIARTWNQITAEVNAERFSATRFDIGEGFLEAYDLDVISGEGFDASSMTATDGMILVNEVFVGSRGWTPESAIGKTILVDSLTYAISGVTANFIYDAFYDPIDPAVLRAVSEEDYRYLSVKVAAASGVQVESGVRDIWKKLVPDKEYNGRFQDTAFQWMFVENTNIKNMFMFIATLALIIACMGLFGLSAQKVSRRMREISIRKVLGASVPHIAGKVNRSFVIILVIAAVIATPLGYMAMAGLLSSIYADPVPIGVTGLLIPIAVVLGTALLTIGSQIRKFSVANPADVLRND